MSFAYAEPYTYSDLQRDLKQYEQIPRINNIMKRESLCTLLTGRSCDVLTITSPDHKKVNSGKFGVILTARVHPGETVGSWMMKGAIDYLLSKDEGAQELRKKCVFKIIPMLNPEGVIQGNYRTSLTGWDLNRKYTNPSQVIYVLLYIHSCYNRQYFMPKV